MADFNQIAGFYDFFKGLVFGKQIDKSSSCFVDHIPANARILIIGGGTGKILKEFKPSHSITFIELSEAMIQKAKRVKTKASIDFENIDVLKWIPINEFDYIITPFILDCFTEDKLNLLFLRLKKSLNKGGEWIHTDFYPKNRLHKVFIKLMYVFFNITANLKVNELANFDLLFEKHQFLLKRKALFYHSMIESKIYQKID